MICRYVLLGLLLQATPLLAATLAGKASEVSDGASVTVTDNAGTQRKVRLAAIDTPETRQPYAKESRQHLTDMVLGKAVKVEWHKQDRYGRIVGKLTLLSPPCASCPKTLDAGLAQLEAGLAWWDRETRREQSLSDQGYYEYAEFDAKARRIGLWQDPAPVPPWEWRKKNQVVARLISARESFANQGKTARQASGRNS